VGCTGALTQTSEQGDDTGTASADAGLPAFDDLDVDRARARFRTTTDLMRHVIAPGCAAEANECHNNEDYPDLSTEGNLWNLRGLPCNLGVGDRETVEDFCEQLGDELRITSGANQGYVGTVGSITVVTDEQGEFSHYSVVLDRAVSAAQSDGGFELMRGGAVIGVLGGGGSLQASGPSTTVEVTRAGDIPDPSLVRQGDENRNGVFGTGLGALVEPGDARGSYLVRRLLGSETARIRMPLNENADNPTEQNRNLSPDEMYALMSWINCMQPGDEVYTPIRYDCAANADNRGAW
jgi:hypothetical protein